MNVHAHIDIQIAGERESKELGPVIVKIWRVQNCRAGQQPRDPGKS